MNRFRLGILAAVTLCAWPAIAATIIYPAGGGTTAVFGPSGPTHAKGLVPDPGATPGSNKALFEDGTFKTITGGGDALTASPLSQFAATTSAQLAATLSNETGTGVAVFNNTPTLVAPVLGDSLATTINKITITAPSAGATLTIANGQTLTVASSLTLPELGANLVPINNLAQIGANTILGNNTAGTANVIAMTMAQLRAIVGLSFTDLAGSAACAQLPALTGNVTTSAGACATTIQSHVVTLGMMATGTAGNVFTFDSSGNPAVTATGTSGQVLMSNGVGTAPTFQNVAGGGDALTSQPLSQFAATSSAQLRGVLSDESGTGAAIFAGGALGAATATTINKLALTQPATGSTLTISDGKTLTVTQDATISGTPLNLGGGTMIGSIIMNGFDIGSLRFLDQTIVANGNSGATPTINWNSGNVQTITLNSATVTMTWTAPTSSSNSAALFLELVQDGSGSRAPVFPSTVLWSSQGAPPVFSTTAGAKDYVSCKYVGASGNFVCGAILAPTHAGGTTPALVIAGGGTGQTTAAAAFDALTVQSGSVASATTTNLCTAAGSLVDVTGTTTITGLGTCAAGIWRNVRFTAALTITNNATSLILPGGSNITTTAGDVHAFRSLGAGNWLCVDPPPPAGTGITAGTGDVTFSGTGSVATTIAANAVTNAKAAQMANATIKCRTTAGTGNPEDCTASQALAITGALATAGGTMSGAVAHGNNSITGIKNLAWNSEIDNGNKTGATQAIADFTTADNEKITLTGNVSSSTWTLPAGVGNTQIKVCEDATGSRTLAWPTSNPPTWLTGSAPTLTTTASKCDLIRFYFDGTTMFGWMVGAGTGGGGGLSAPVANSSLATMTTNTIKGNNTGSTATPSDLSVFDAVDLLMTGRGNGSYFIQDSGCGIVGTPWLTNSAGSGASTVGPSTAANPCTIAMTTGTTTTGETSRYHEIQTRVGGGQLRARNHLQVPVLSNGTDTFTAYWGWGTLFISAQPTDGIYFLQDTHTNYQCVTKAAGTATTTDSGVAVDASSHGFGIVVNAAGNAVSWEIDNTAVCAGASQTNIPATTTSMYRFTVILKSAGTTSVTLNFHRQSEQFAP